MSTEALSQNEIDALLAQSQSVSGAHEDSGKPGKSVFSYNFSKQRKFNKNDFISIEHIHKKFVRNIEISLTNVLNTPIMGTLAAATELSYGDCLDSFASPTCIYVLSINGNQGKFILEIDPNFVFFVIERILGGNSNEIHLMDRELSQIEERIMQRVVNFLLKDLVHAWARVEKLLVELDVFYAQPDYVQVVSKSEPVILVSMDMRTSEKNLGYLNLCLPGNVLDGLNLRGEKEADTRHVAESSPQDRRKLEQNVNNSILPLRVILGQTNMSVTDLLSLGSGDIINLDKEDGGVVDVYVGNLKMYKAIPSKKDNALTIQIAEVIAATEVA